MHLLAENVLRATKTPESWLGSYPSKSSSVTSTTETLSNAKISRDAKNETFEDKTRCVARVPFPDHLHLDMVELLNRLQSVANLVSFTGDKKRNLNKFEKTNLPKFNVPSQYNM